MNSELINSKWDTLQWVLQTTELLSARVAGWPMESVSASTDARTPSSAGTPSHYYLIKKVKLWSRFNCCFFFKTD